MSLPFESLRGVLEQLNAALPRLVRVGVYANGRAVEAKTDAELTELRGLKLHTLYMGLESGDPEVLRRVGKLDPVETMVSACRRAQACGLRMSVMVLVGLAGRAGSERHVRLTCQALEAMQPRLLSALRYIPIPGTALNRAIERGEFDQQTEAESICELRNLVAGLDGVRTVFRANHSSNVVPLEARLPKGRDAVLEELDALLASGLLDTDGPGPMPFYL